MDLPDLSICLHWFDETVQLLQRFFVVVVAAFIAIRFEWLRQALRGAELKWRYRVPAIGVFGLLAILGTHSGIPIDIHQGLRAIDLSAELPEKLGETQAIVGFRDTMALVAGLIGGPWVGLGAGLLAGAERYPARRFCCACEWFSLGVIRCVCRRYTLSSTPLGDHGNRRILGSDSRNLVTQATHFNPRAPLQRRPGLILGSGGARRYCQ